MCSSNAKLNLCLLLVVLLWVGQVSGQYIARLEPYPYTGFLTACAGEQITVRGNQIQNLNNPSTITARLSDAVGDLSLGTDLPIDEWSFDAINWTPGNYIWTNDINGPVYYRVTLPANFIPGAAYNLVLQSSSPAYWQTNQPFNAVLNLTGGNIIPQVGFGAAGMGQWYAHAYTWMATTPQPLFTSQLINQQDFFNPANYLGHLQVNSLSFDLNFTVDGYMPGTQHDGTSISCQDHRSVDYALRFRRTENFTLGSYRFEIQGDDGIRFSIDGGQTWLLDAFIEQPWSTGYRTTDTDNPGGICLSGPVDLVIEYFQRPIDHRVTFTATRLSPEVENPEFETVCEGDQAVFTAGSTSTQLTYQWQVSGDGGVTWTNVNDGPLYSGTTTAQLTVLAPTTSMDGYLFRCQVNGICSTPIATEPAELTVQPGGGILEQPPTNLELCDGDDAAVLNFLVANGQDYTWSMDRGSGFAPLPGGGIFQGVGTPELTISPVTSSLDGVLIRCSAQSGCSGELTSNAVIINVGTSPEFTVQPVDQSACPGTPVYFESEVTNVNGLQWLVSTDEGQTWNIPNPDDIQGVSTATILTLESQPEYNGWMFQATLPGCREPVLSDVVSLEATGSDGDQIIPNVITPNNDGFNDELKFEVEGATVFDVRVYNRWGQEMAHLTTPDQSWTGLDTNGEEVPVGHYFLTVDIEAPCVRIEGSHALTVLR